MSTTKELIEQRAELEALLEGARDKYGPTMVDSVLRHLDKSGAFSGSREPTDPPSR